MALFRNKRESDEESGVIRELAGVFLYIMIVLVLIVVIHLYVGERTEVSGDSMNDTLEDGDSLWLDKLTYHFQDPKRYDIVVFPHIDAVTGNEVLYVKRIIGLPGETISITDNGNILVDGKTLEESYGKEIIDLYHIGIASEPIVLGDDEYFVMGDNRNNSKDSRDPEVGNISRDELEGRVVFRMWPLQQIGSIK